MFIPKEMCIRDSNTLDSLNKARTSRPEAGSSRKGDNPVLFLVGNSTMRTGTLGNGNNGQWGWGYYAGDYFDSNRITVENHALGGTSSRTFYNRLWPVSYTHLDVYKRQPVFLSTTRAGVSLSI